MGFGSKSRKEAKINQEAAFRAQQDAQARYQQMIDQYNSNFNTRNAGVIDMNTKAQDWMKKFDKGTDIASLIPSYAKTQLESAEAMKKTQQFASRLGDNASNGVNGDANYQAKLGKEYSSNVGREMARQNMSALEGELGNQRNIVMDTSQFLNQDRQVGLNNQGNAFQFAGQLFNSATQKREMEMQRSQAMMGNLMGFISAGVGAFTGMGGIGMLSKGLGGGTKPMSASPSGGAFQSIPNYSSPSGGAFSSNGFSNPFRR